MGQLTSVAAKYIFFSYTVYMEGIVILSINQILFRVLFNLQRKEYTQGKNKNKQGKPPEGIVGFTLNLVHM